MPRSEKASAPGQLRPSGLDGKSHADILNACDSNNHSLSDLKGGSEEGNKISSIGRRLCYRMYAMFKRLACLHWSVCLSLHQPASGSGSASDSGV